MRGQAGVEMLLWLGLMMRLIGLVGFDDSSRGVIFSRLRGSSEKGRGGCELGSAGRRLRKGEGILGLSQEG